MSDLADVPANTSHIVRGGVRHRCGEQCRYAVAVRAALRAAANADRRTLPDAQALVFTLIDALERHRRFAGAERDLAELAAAEAARLRCA